MPTLDLSMWGGYTAGYIPDSAMVFVDGVFLEPEFGARVKWANNRVKQEDDGWIYENEGNRPYGREGDDLIAMRLEPASTTSTGGSNVWYQWGRYKLWLKGDHVNGTPSATDPRGGVSLSMHSRGKADDSNTNLISRRLYWSAQVGLEFPISSETWHRQPKALSVISDPQIAAEVAAIKAELLAAKNPSPPEEEDIMASLEDLDKKLEDKLQPVYKQLRQLTEIPATQKGFADQINGQYQNVLGRDADPGGLSMFLNLMTNLDWTIDKVRDALIHSDEYANNLTATLYQTYLGRIAGPQELLGWVSWARANGVEKLETAISSSPEAQARK